MHSPSKGWRFTCNPSKGWRITHNPSKDPSNYCTWLLEGLKDCTWSLNPSKIHLWSLEGLKECVQSFNPSKDYKHNPSILPMIARHPSTPWRIACDPSTFPRIANLIIRHLKIYWLLHPIRFIEQHHKHVRDTPDILLHFVSNQTHWAML